MKTGRSLILTLIAMLVLVACGAQPTPTSAPPTGAPTSVATTAPPTAAPTAGATTAAIVGPKGAMVDEVVFFEEPDRAKAINILEAGDMHIYGLGISDPKVFAQVKDSKNLAFDFSYGSYNELTFNPSGPAFKDGRLNPFSVAAIREAMNWLVDRDYIAKEIFGGLAVPMWTHILPVFPDYARIADTMEAIKIKYAPDQKKAQSVISDEMKKLGAELTGGKWTYKGQPVTVSFLIRTEDQRRAIGDYVSKQLEDIGFTVDRQYKTAAEASPIWNSSDPAEGKWYIYTGGWINTSINRDRAGDFDSFYTKRGGTSPLWQAYKPLPEFDKVAERLDNSDFKDIAERQQLMKQASELSLKDSARVWLTNQVSVWVRRKEVSVSSDLTGGYVSSLWPFAIQFPGKTGGQLKLGQPSQLTEPWNAVAGSNFVYDNTINRATRNPAVLPDPYTGLRWPQLVSNAEVTVEQGTPVIKTLDWVTLKTAPKIEVPKDAWADWDAEKQQFITAGERFTSTVTAKTKTVVTYRNDMFKTKWHDGSTLSLGDFVLRFIMRFDRAKEKSPIYDESTLSAFKTFMQNFKGARIVQKDPLVVEYYSDQTYLDAEWIADDASAIIFPVYSQGINPWHTIALGIQAETNKEIAFGTNKATKLKVEWMNYLAGPTLPVLQKYLDQSSSKPFIPYEKTLSQYITADEAASRYKAAAAFVKDRGHFWIANGPFLVHSVRTTEKIVSIRKFTDFAESVAQWTRFSEPKLATVAVSGPSRVTAGQPTSFSVKITFKNQPYETKDIDFVKFLVIDATGNVAFSADAKAVKDGEFSVDLTADQTNKLAAGSNRLQVIAVSKVVAIPASESFTFVTLK